MAFVGTRVTEAVWPEAVAVAGVVGANLLTRALDAKAGRVATLARWNTWTLAGMGAVSALAIGYGKSPTLAKTALICTAVPITDRLMTPLIESATGVAIRAISAAPQSRSLPASRATPALPAKAGVGYSWKETEQIPHLV